MKSKSLVLMVVAMGCGLVAAYTTAKLTAKGGEDDEMILVANSEIKIGTVVKEPEKLFVLSPHKKGTAPGAVQDIEKLKDKILTRSLRPGNFVTFEDLSSNFGISPPKGTKAMAIKVTADAAVGGFIMPGCRVDVLATIAEQNEKIEVLTVLQNQEVLAVDKISVRPDGQSAVDTINNVTLAVTPQNAQKLELALRKSGGIVRLLLRDQNDTVINRLPSTKGLTESGGEFGSIASDGVLIKALVAKTDLKPGTVIDDPEKTFTSTNVAILPERGYQEADLGKLKGQTIRVPVFKDSFVTVKHFELQADEVAKTQQPAAPPPPEPVRTVLFIQNGGKEPQMVVYQDGVMVTGESVAPAPKPFPVPPAPKTEKPADKPADEAVPEPKKS